MRLRRIEAEAAADVRLEWHSFLLRPHPDPQRTLEAFRTYTQSWRRPAADLDGGTFRVWATNEGPPSHSVPPHLLAKAARLVGPEAFAAVHERLLHAYFADNRDITHADTLLSIWRDAGLSLGAFERVGDPALVQEMVEQHNAAVALGVTGVPAVRVADTELFLVGAQPIDTYRHWIGRVRAVLNRPTTPTTR